MFHNQALELASAVSFGNPKKQEKSMAKHISGAKQVGAAQTNQEQSGLKHSGQGHALVDAEAQMESFKQARAARRTELVEDYIELIADLIDDGGEARQVDIAARLGVAQPTVAKMLKRLAEDGLILHKRYRGIFLTDLGLELARESRERHRIVETFLLALGICPDIARRDAEGIEHHVSPETLAAFQKFAQRAA